jgi:hypothetical protein
MGRPSQTRERTRERDQHKLVLSLFAYSAALIYEVNSATCVCDREREDNEVERDGGDPLGRGRCGMERGGATTTMYSKGVPKYEDILKRGTGDVQVQGEGASDVGRLETGQAVAERSRRLIGAERVRHKGRLGQRISWRAGGFVVGRPVEIKLGERGVIPYAPFEFLSYPVAYCDPPHAVCFGHRARVRGRASYASCWFYAVCFRLRPAGT